MIQKLRPRDIVAIVILVLGAVLRLCGSDGVVASMMIAVTASYFGYEKISDKFIGPKVEYGKKEPVDDVIKRVCKEESVDYKLALRVAKCESGLDPNAKNVNKGGSVDRGLFQWNDKYHSEVSDDCAYNPECATRRFCKAVENGNLHWWNATKKCWNGRKLRK